MNTPVDYFRKTMALEEVTHVPVIPIMGTWIENFSGIPLEKLHYDKETAVKVQINVQKAVGNDALFAASDPLCIPEAFGCSIG